MADHSHVSWAEDESKIEIKALVEGGKKREIERGAQ